MKCLAWTVSFLLVGPLALAQPTLTSADADRVVTAGFYVLRWSGSEGATFALEESETADFSAPRQLYQGTDTAKTVTGKRDGTYHYRIRETDREGAWSAPVVIEVTHHSLGRAWQFFAIGAVVFVLSLLTILRGAHEADGTVPS